MIAYKVVVGDRVSAFIGLSGRSNISSSEKETLEKYILKYPKGKTVNAKKNTLGIFVFKTRKQAKIWADCRSDNGHVLKVKTMGRGKEPKEITTDISDIIRLFQGKKVDVHGYVADGTICYPVVKVLD